MKNLKRLLQQLLMIKRIIAFVFDPLNVAITNSVPAFKDACDDLKLLADAIDLKIADYRRVIKGITTAKRNARTALADTSFTAMSSVRSYALKNNLQELAAQMLVNLAELRTMPFQVLTQKISGAITIVQPLVPQLADFNITPASFLAWQQSLQNMNDLINGPKSAIAHRKSVGSIITTDMHSTMEFFNGQVDTLTGNFLNQPEFYIGFQNNKRIGSPNIHHTRLIAHVVDELGTPFYGLTVQVDSVTDPDTGKTYKAVSAVTNANGDCEVSEFFNGMRTVTISGTGVQTVTFPAMKFENGKAVVKTFTCQPSFSNIPAPVNTNTNVPS